MRMCWDEGPRRRVKHTNKTWIRNLHKTTSQAIDFCEKQRLAKKLCWKKRGLGDKNTGDLFIERMNDLYIEKMNEYFKQKFTRNINTQEQISIQEEFH